MLHYMKMIVDLEHETSLHDSLHGSQHLISTSIIVVGGLVSCISLEGLPL